jgi:ABC-type transport system involved in cytochrome bd biosynthesis fused ATPase/permease subunit
MSKINFGYEKTILNSSDVEFKKCDIVHISGASGSGKTTFIELLSGLIRDGCKLRVNGNELISDEEYSNFQQGISYVPQNTFLFDDTIMNNIKFSQNIEYLDKSKIDKIIDICSLNDLLVQNNKDFKIGEFGSRLSGGQKQRVSIARSLMKNSDILILDESTNALDFESENKILSNIIKSKFFKIIIIISHNQKLAKYCNKILKINNGQIIKT